MNRKEPMELKDYVRIIGKNIWLVLVLGILTGALAYLFTMQSKTTYNGFKTITINKAAESSSNANYYQYDGYYSASAANLQTKGLAAWLNTSTAVSQIYQKASLTIPEITDKSLKNYITVTNSLDSNVVAISMSDSSKDDLQKKLDSIDSVTQGYFNGLEGSSQYSLKFSDGSIASQTPSKTTNLIAGVLAGLIIGLVLVFAKEYFSKA